MLYGTHPNFCFTKASFMLGTLDEIAADNGLEMKKLMRSLKFDRF